MAEQKEEKEDRRKRARETIAFLLQRVEEVCGQVKRVDSVGDQIEEIAGQIRDFAEATETKDLLPGRVQRRLRDAWQRFEQAKDRSDALADACDQVQKALKVANGALGGGAPWGIVAAAAVAGGAAAGGLTALILFLAIPQDDGPVVTATPTPAVASATPTWTMTPVARTATPTATPTVPRPANDGFVNAEPIETLPFSDSAETVFATLEEDEPQPSCISDAEIDGTLWYSFTPAANLTLDADTFESSFDTVLAVYVGGALEELEEVECDNDALGGSQSRLSIDVSADETYYFQVGGLGGDRGDLAFNVSELGPF